MDVHTATFVWHGALICVDDRNCTPDFLLEVELAVVKSILEQVDA